MAFTAKTAFESYVTNDRNSDITNVAGKYQSSSADADCSAGFLVKRASKLPLEGFSGSYNDNAYIFNTAVSTDIVTEPIYACNPYESQMLANGSNRYHVGQETLGLGAPAGQVTCYEQISFDNVSQYAFGEGNIESAISTNQYFTINNGLLKPQASAPVANGAIYFKLEKKGSFTKGTRTAFDKIIVTACRVVA